MSVIKHVKNAEYQNWVGQRFELENADTNEIITLDYIEGFEEVDFSIDINEDFFNIDNFIIGENVKAKINEYSQKKAFDFVKKIYDEKGGDGRILFRWYIPYHTEGSRSGGTINSLLGDDYEINLNKYKLSYEQSGRVIELEVKKRENQNKFLTREDTTINLFATKNLDGNAIEPVRTKDIILKSEIGEIKSLWRRESREEKDLFRVTGQAFPQNGQNGATVSFNYNYNYQSFFRYFPKLKLSEEERQAGGNEDFGADITYQYRTSTRVIDSIRTRISVSISLNTGNKAPFFQSNSELENVIISLSNFNFRSIYSEREGRLLPFSLYLLVENGYNTKWFKVVAKSESIGGGWSEMNIGNDMINIGNLSVGDKLYLYFNFETMPFLRVGGANFLTGSKFIIRANPSVRLFYSTLKSARKSRVIDLYDALEKVTEHYSDGGLSFRSDFLQNKMTGQVVSIGSFLRGVGRRFLGADKINTSFKSLFYEGASPLLALGFDIGRKILNNKAVPEVRVEPIEFFFKDHRVYDFRDKSFVQESLIIEHDLDLSYNQLSFGTKKYSTKTKGDIHNFNTKIEGVTPIKSAKKKFEKVTELVIDEYKIQSLLEDKTEQTGDNDDDLVLIDTVSVSNFTDTFTETKINHSKEREGVLKLTHTELEWDTLPIHVGQTIKITSGLNRGEWRIMEIKPSHLLIDKFGGGVELGEVTTSFEYEVTNVIKNRNAQPDEGWKQSQGVKNAITCTNLAHNPKYQLKRWFPFFGGGLSKKTNAEEIKITNYKNNGNITTEPDTEKIPFLKKGTDKLNEDISLEKLRQNNHIFFNGLRIEITLTDVSLVEFCEMYEVWRYGGLDKAGNEIKSRGYIDVFINGDSVSIYPFGAGAFIFDKGANELTIRGKIKNTEWGRQIFSNEFENKFE